MKIGSVGMSGISNSKYRKTSADCKTANGFRELLEDSKVQKEKNQDTLSISSEGATSVKGVDYTEMPSEKIDFDAMEWDTNYYSMAEVKRRLDILQKVHEQTDYSGMEPVDREIQVYKNFNKAFPCYRGVSCSSEIRGLVDDARHRMAFDAVGCENRIWLTREQYLSTYGLDGLTDDEIFTKLAEQCAKDDSLCWKKHTTELLHSLNLIDDDTYGISWVVFSKIEYDKFFAENPSDYDVLDQEKFKNWHDVGGVDKVKMSWSEMKSWITANVKMFDPLYESDEEKNKCIDKLYSFLDKMIELEGKVK